MSWLTDAALDFWHGRRIISRRPLLAVVVITSLAVGIAGVTAVASFVEATALRQLNVPDPDALVQFHWRARQWLPDRLRMVGPYTLMPVPSGPIFTGASFTAMRRALGNSADVFAFSRPTQVNTRLARTTFDARAQFVSGTYFSTLRVAPIAGRTMVADDDEPTAAPVAVISDALWRKLGRDPAALDSLVVCDGVEFTVVGVAGPGFAGTAPVTGARPEIWLPAAFAGRFNWLKDPASLWWLFVMARLKPGVSGETVASTANAAFGASVIETWVPPRDDVPQLATWPGRRGSHDSDHEVERRYTVILGGAFGALLLVLCLNVGNLLIARGAGRDREMAMRLALGANRFRLVRQLLTEAMTLAIAGAAGGVILGYWAIALLGASGLVRDGADLWLSPSVLGASLLAATAMSLLVSAWSAVRLTGASHAGRLTAWLARERSASTSNRLLLGTQIATTLMILFGAVTVGRSLQAMSAASPGFDTGNLVLFDVQPAPLGYAETELPQLADQLSARLRRVPGVTGVTASGSLESRLFPGRIVSNGERRGVYVRWLPIRDDFFDILRVPVRAGRTFTPADAARPPAVAVIDDALATALYGRESPLGRHLTFGQNDLDVEIVGVVGRIMSADAQSDTGPMTMYFPEVTQRADLDPKNVLMRGSDRERYGRTFAIRVASASPSLTRDLAQAVADVDSRLPVIGLTTAMQALADKRKPMRVVGIVALAFTAVAVSLTTIALYALVSNSVVRRTREIAIRIAIGSSWVGVLRTITAETLLVLIGGISVGVLGAILVGQMLQSTVPSELNVADPIATLQVVALTALVACAATLIPVSKALRIRPAEALNQDY
jgi:predicted permease